MVELTEIVKGLIVKVGEAFHLRVPFNYCQTARSHYGEISFSIVYNVLVSSKTDKCAKKCN